MKTIRLILATAMIAGLLAFTGGIASAHNTQSAQGSLDCQGTYQVTGMADWWGTITLDLYINGDKVQSLPGGDVTHDSRPFTFDGGTAAPGDSFYVKTSDSSHTEGGTFTAPTDCVHYAPSASSKLTCTGMSLTAQGFNPNLESNAQWIIDGGSQVDHPFTGAGFWTHALNLYKPHTVTFRVWYKNDGQKTIVYEKTRTIEACKTVKPKIPVPSIQGPCADPMYRASFKNPTDVDLSGKLRWKDINGVWHNTVVTVAAHSTKLTGYKHVLEFTAMKASIGGVSVTEKAAAGGWYGTCPK